MDFTFDPRKAASNYQKHRVRFAEAGTCLLDPQALVLPNDDPHAVEERFALLGLSDQGRLIYRIYTLRDEIPRLISARLASARQERQYHGN